MMFTRLDYELDDAKIFAPGRVIHLVGHIHTTYAALCRLFGAPATIGPGGDDKIDVDWWLEFDDGTIAWIHNHKDGPNYLGGHGTPVEQITDWHVGGRGEHAHRLVHAALTDTASSPDSRTSTAIGEPHRR
jgi:hypothetical protein